MSMSESYRVEHHFTGRGPQVRKIYDRLLKIARSFGDVTEDPKKTSIHLNRKSAFAGVATRKDAIVLTIKSTEDIESPRVIKRQKQSASRWYLDIRLTTPADVDGELKKWLAASYGIS